MQVILLPNLAGACRDLSRIAAGSTPTLVGSHSDSVCAARSRESRRRRLVSLAAAGWTPVLLDCYVSHRARLHVFVIISHVIIILPSYYVLVI
jgi:hypothetical protein